MWCREISEHGGHETSGLVRSEGGRVHGHEENGYGMEVGHVLGLHACMYEMDEGVRERNEHYNGHDDGF